MFSRTELKRPDGILMPSRIIADNRVSTKNEKQDSSVSAQQRYDLSRQTVENTGSYNLSETRLDDDSTPEGIEVLVIHRLPGETLGMEVDIKRPLGHDSRVYGVFVSSVTPGGPAEKASGSENGICVGDEILQINGTHLRDMSHTEAVQIFNEMPLRVTVLVKRAQERRPMPYRNQVKRYGDRQTYAVMDDDASSAGGSDVGSSGDEDVYHVHQMSSYALQTCKPSFVHEGYELRKLVFKKHVTERLGLQIEPVLIGVHAYYQVSLLLTDSSILTRLSTHPN